MALDYQEAKCGTAVCGDQLRNYKQAPVAAMLTAQSTTYVDATIRALPAVSVTIQAYPAISVTIQAYPLISHEPLQ